MSASVSQPGVVTFISGIRDRRYPPPCVNIFRKYDYRIRRLQNLKRVWQIYGSRKAGKITLFHRVGGQAIFEILFLLGQRVRLVGNFSTFNNTESRRYLVSTSVVQKIPVRRVADLPNALQVGVAVRRARRSVGF